MLLVLDEVALEARDAVCLVMDRMRLVDDLVAVMVLGGSSASLLIEKYCAFAVMAASNLRLVSS